MVLAFALGLVARALKSDLEIPPQIQVYLSIFLLLAIGLKGGVSLREAEVGPVLILIAMTIAAGVVSTLSAYALARWWLGDDRREAAALAAHYGSVSAVTFIAANQFMQQAGTPAEGLLVALVVALEVPALIMGLAIGRERGSAGHGLGALMREVMTSKTVVLLLGGLAIGAIAGPGGIKSVDAMYFALFQGVLMLFMLDMGMLAAGRLAELRRGWWRLGVYATLLPLAHGLLGTWVGYLCGLSPAGSAVFGTLVSSASYIAAPAAVRAGLPEANAGRCITAALGITFPFNLAIGIPAYAGFAAWLAG